MPVCGIIYKLLDKSERESNQEAGGIGNYSNMLLNGRYALISQGEN